MAGRAILAAWPPAVIGRAFAERLTGAKAVLRRIRDWIDDLPRHFLPCRRYKRALANLMPSPRNRGSRWRPINPSIPRDEPVST